MGQGLLRGGVITVPFLLPLIPSLPFLKRKRRRMKTADTKKQQQSAAKSGAKASATR